MKTIKNFDWILNFINEVIIIDKDYSVVFCGAKIKESFSDPILTINSNFLDSFLQKSEITSVKRKIDSILEKPEFDSLELKSISKTLFFLPAKYNCIAHIIISTSERILQTSRMEHDLQKRIKELECLYKTSSVFELTDNIEDALKENDVKKANEVYARLMATYSKLQKSEKAIVFKRCTDLRNKIIAIKMFQEA